MERDLEFFQDLQDPEYVTAFIKDWNESRLDMFALSPPNENLVFSGVMRFYFQDRGQKAATKCIRVTNKQTVAEIMAILIEKFCPDMKMLSTPNYELYEIHGTGDVRKLGGSEFPLLVQLLWHHDDREGRFVLKSVDLKIHAEKFFEANHDEGQLKRRLSRREKKDLKKKRKEELKRRNEAKENGIFEQIPESSFTRTISNPEAVMRRRRQQKLEKRMKEFTSKEGPQTGGILKIFAESLKPEIPYKTILASVRDNADIVTKAALEKFLLSKEDPFDYCIVMAIVPLGDSSLENAKERVIRSSDCPLAIQNSWPKNKGHITFHLRRKIQGSDPTPPPREPARDREIRNKNDNVPRQPPPHIEKPKLPPIERNISGTSVDLSLRNSINGDLDFEDEMPYFLELTPEGKEINYKPKIYYIKPQETIIGSSRNPSPGVQYLQLFSPKILASHCSIVNADSSVSIVPHGPEADVRVGGERVYDNTLLQTGDVVQFGGLHTFRFCNPHDYETEQIRPSDHGYSGYNQPQQNFSSPPMSPEQIERILNEQHGTNIDDDDSGPENEIETTFGVDHTVETKVAKPNMYPAHSAENIIRDDGSTLRDSVKSTNRQSAPDLSKIQDPAMDGNLLPASLAFLDHGKDAFFATVTGEVDGATVSFKLAPTYTLYLAARHALSASYRPGLTPTDRSRVVSTITKRIAASIQQTIQENDCQAGRLAFWMANASELLHFYRQDIDLGPITQAAQAILAQSIQESFALLVNAMEEELSLALPAFLDPTDTVDILPQDLDSILNDDLLERAESMELLNWTTASAADNEFNDPRLTMDSYTGEQWITPASRIRYHGLPIMADVLYILSSAMSLLRRCRVNAALTIQLFSQLFHYINMWTFNRIVLEPDLKLCTRLWGHCLRMRLSFIEAWAERQGLELAADCHLARVVQAAHLLEATKDSAEAIAEVASACFKLNSIQLRTLLENYLPEMDEPIIPQDLIDSIVSVAESTADELTQTDGREVKLEEDIQLQLPFLLPEEGYSSDIIRGVPPGLQEFLEPLCSIGVCELTLNAQSHGLWTVYQMPYAKDHEIGDDEGVVPEENQVEEMQLPIERVTINKGKSGLGLSICATKGSQTEFTGIYIKAVVKGGLAAQDGRLLAGDQILSVNESSLIDVSQTQAAKIMGRCGSVITLEVMKGAAFYHGLAKLVEGEITLDQVVQPPAPAPVEVPTSQPRDEAPPAIPSHGKQNSGDSREISVESAVPPHVQQRRKSTDSTRSHTSDDGMKPPSHTPPPPVPRHKRDRSADSAKSSTKSDETPPPPAHRKQKSNDSSRSQRSKDDELPPPPVPAHRKQKSGDSGKSSRDGSPKSHRKNKDKGSHSRDGSEDSGVVQSDSPKPPRPEKPAKPVKPSRSKEPMVTEPVEEVSMEPEPQPAPIPAVEDENSPVGREEEKLKAEDQRVVREDDEDDAEGEEKEEEAVAEPSESDYDSEGNILSEEDKERRKRQLQRQKEYEERLAKWEEQKRLQEEKKQREEEEAARLEEERRQEEEEAARKEEEERKKEEEAEKLYEAEVKKKQLEKLAREEEEERQRKEDERIAREEEERLRREELQRKREEREREEERLRLVEMERLKQVEEEEEVQRRLEEEEEDRRRLEAYRLQQLKLKEEEEQRMEEERRKEKLRLIEERQRKEEEEEEERCRVEEEKRRLEYEAHVERRRLEHENMMKKVKEKEEREKQAEVQRTRRENESSGKRTSVIEKRAEFDSEMSNLDDALREAERIAAEMDMFMMEEEQKLEEDIKEKRIKEKEQWETEHVPPVPTSPLKIPPLSVSTKGLSIEQEFPPPPKALLPSISDASDSSERIVEAEQGRWLREQKEKREKFREDQERKREERAKQEEEEEKAKKMKEMEEKKNMENKQMEEYRQAIEDRECREREEREEASKPKPKPPPPPVKVKNYRNSRADLPVVAPKPSPPRSRKSSSDEDEAPPPRPPPPKTVKSPTTPPVSVMNNRNSYGFPECNPKIPANTKPPDRVAPPSPPPTAPEPGEVFGRRNPEPVVVNQGVDVPEILDFKAKMKLFGNFQG